jgi:crossover junction endonuclease MUS81
MTTKIILEIDYREKAIIKHIEENKPNITYKISNLPIGDFAFKEDGGIDNDIHYIIERKTILDLAASITDGRFREQKQRLLDSIGTYNKIVYILEGNKNQKKFGSISKAIIDSSILNLIFRHKYKVIHTSSDIETYDTLLSIYKKLECGDFEKSVENTSCKLIKKGDNVNNNILVNMLSVIPGISLNIAKKIKENYSSLPILINSYNSLSVISEREKLLSTIQLTDKRKLGVALSKKIYNSLYINKENKEGVQDCLLD